MPFFDHTARKLEDYIHHACNGMARSSRHSVMFSKISMSSRHLFLPLCAVFSSWCSAQIGDSADKAGEVQKSLVPADQIPPAPPLSPQDALKTLKVAPGYRVELAAAEPQVQEPVAVAFTPDGRMWVAEMRGYMPDVDGNGEDLPSGRVVVLADGDGDGFFESSSVFADDLIMPRAILPVADGILVGTPPLLEFLQDTDGDGKADKRETVAGDYGVKVDPKRPHLANPERAPNSLLWNYDNWIYSAAYTRKFRFTPGGPWKMEPTSFRGQWGLTQDAYGRLYHCSNSDHVRVDLIPSHYLSRNVNFPALSGTNVNAAADQLVWPARVNPGINRGYRPEMLRNGRLKEFTAAGGNWIYDGDLLPDLKGNYFIPEPAGNFVRRSKMAHANGTVSVTNAYPSDEFLTSTDERFRPVNVTTGPDGALYIADFYRGILQHRISLTSYLRNQILDRQLDKHLHRGRIYRIVPDIPTASIPRRVASPVGDEWLARLSHPNHWWREAAQRHLVTQGDTAHIPALRKLATEGSSMRRVHALWTLEGLGGDALDADTLVSSLSTSDPILLSHAIRLSEPFLKAGKDSRIQPLVLKAALGAPPESMLQAILSLGETNDPALELKLADSVRKYPENKHLLDAFLSGLKDREFEFLVNLSAQSSWQQSQATHERMFTQLARGVMGSRKPEHCAKIVELAADALKSGNATRAVSLLDGLLPVSGSSRRPLELAAEPVGWNTLMEHQETKPKTVALTNVIIWPGKQGVTAALKPKPLAPEQQARFEAGKHLYASVCAACHQADGRGLEGLAPPLLDSEWVLGPSGRPIRIILHGVRGPIRVLGKVHTGDMPPMGAALDDVQLASLLTYLRREWGHTASPVDPEEVTAVRKATANHTDAWSPEELMKIK
jgi:mono/diheme cytochrome c family protein/glucose/arabinose dehydrogenase